ncbi:MAG: homoserine kinase [Phormidium sp.]
MSTVSITVPATTANLGPGFDCIGAALSLYNEFQFTQINTAETKLKINVTGTEALRVQTDESNLLYQAFLKLYQHIEKTPPSVEIDIKLGVPLARGLGSSATAIVGGLVGANLLAGEPLRQVEVMQLAIEMEGHPDNVVPALLGGCRLAATGLVLEPQRHGERREEWEICNIPWHWDVIPVLAIPDFELSTSEARSVLPSEYSRKDAVFNTAHLGLLVRGLESGRGDWLRVAMQDKIHQPYRKSLIQGYDTVYSAAVNAGAYGMVISGAGPTLLALASTTQAESVAKAMESAWQEAGVTAEAKVLKVDFQGARRTDVEF